jgi:hypothetical protein
MSDTIKQRSPLSPRKALHVRSGFYAPGMVPAVHLEYEGRTSELTIETAYAVANALYIGASYAECDGFLIAFFAGISDGAIDKGALRKKIESAREDRAWPPPLFDKAVRMAYGITDTTGLPYVSVTIDGDTTFFSAEAARELAHEILLATERSRGDVSVVDYLRRESDDSALPNEVVQQIIGMFDIYRMESRAAQREVDTPHAKSA